MNRSVKMDLPYPDPSLLTPDPCAARQLARAYATLESEFTAVSQYIFHHFNFYEMGMPDMADALEQIAIAEMFHLGLLGKALIKLGVSPVFSFSPPRLCNFFNTCSVKYSVEPQCMILDDIKSENDAIALYKDILCNLHNDQAAAIVQRIILDEELHLLRFNEILHELCAST